MRVSLSRVLLCVAATLAIVACQGAEQEGRPAEAATGETAEPAVEQVEVVGFTEEELAGPTGTLEVEAIDLFHGGLCVIDGEGRKIALGHCNKAWPVPVGTYTVKAKPREYPEMDLGEVTIAEGEATTAKLTGFGWLNVEASENFGVSIVPTEGEEIPLGHCNKTWIVPVGTYVVKVKPDRYPEVDLGEVTVEEEKEATTKLTGFGRLNVEASENFEVSIVPTEGEEMPLDHCNKEWVVPIGTYTVKVRDKEVKGVVVHEAKTTIVNSGA